MKRARPFSHAASHLAAADLAHDVAAGDLDPVHPNCSQPGGGAALANGHMTIACKGDVDDRLVFVFRAPRASGAVLDATLTHEDAGVVPVAFMAGPAEGAAMEHVHGRN